VSQAPACARQRQRRRILPMCHLRGVEELADFAIVGQSAFCQGWQLCVKNAASLGWIITT
jgi:hypothetical protein